MNTYPPPSSAPPAERVRLAWQRRHETDYIFDFWTAFGWTILTCSIYGFYVFYQLMRRMREHNRRRLELLEAANELAWEQANTRGMADELRPTFERIGANLAVLRGMTTDFRDPAIWLVLDIVAALVSIGSLIVHFVAFILLDGDLIKHDTAESQIEADLSAVFARLGHAVPPSDPGRIKGKHNYVGRIIASIFSGGIYLIWWWRDMLAEPNAHFEQNWVWEDGLADAVQALTGAV